MSLLYRSIFTPRVDEDPLPAVRDTFQAWLNSKAVPLSLPDSGSASQQGLELSVADVTEGDIHALRLSLTEERVGEVWSTTVTAVCGAATPWIWVDLERVSDDPYGKPPIIGVPRVARNLLERWSCSAGITELATSPVVIDEAGVGALVAQLTDPGRIIPLIVISKDRYASAETALARAEMVLDKVVGLATVVVLEGAATSSLSEALGADLHVFGGAARTYMPELSIPDRNPKRNAYIAGTVLAGQTSAAATRIQRLITQQAVAQRPPQIYRDTVASLPGFPRHRGESKDEELVGELIALETERDQLRDQLKGLRDELEYSALQLDETEAELDGSQARVRYLEQRLRQKGDQTVHEPTPAASIPETAESCADAIGLVRQYLGNLDIGDTDYLAGQLDTHIKSPAWARKAWRAFRALQDYTEMKAAGEFSGDFQAYCSEAPAGRSVIPAGWVALRESESTDNNPKYRGVRTFPVPEDVDSSEVVYMCAHVKLEAGGRPAPRIHFYDDTSGTGMVYVGYFGEHLPNDQTN